MAALRHAAKKVCERALRQSQGVRRPMSSYLNRQDALERIRDKKEELFDLMAQDMNFLDSKALLPHLSKHVKPRPHDPVSLEYNGEKKTPDPLYVYVVPFFCGILAYFDPQWGKIKKEEEAELDGGAVVGQDSPNGPPESVGSSLLPGP